MRLRPVIRLLAVLVLTGLFSLVFAQGSFVSGSTGADGAFNPTTNQSIQIPESGVFNYTTVNIPGGVTITYLRNSRNTPLTILATGNVVINGTLNVDGKQATSRFAGGLGGPGGFNGGHGAFGFSGIQQGGNGEGPGGGGGGRYINNSAFGAAGGGGYATAGQDGGQSGGQGAGIGGPIYGAPTLTPLIGGSGGGGGAAPTGASFTGASGGGGGGAIVIASSGTISGSGIIYARGGDGLNIVVSTINSYAGGGSGGAIRLIANVITGSIRTDVTGGTGPNFGTGGAGYVRLEAYDLGGYSPNVAPATAIFTVSTPRSALPSNLPQLQITSVAGINAPANPIGTFNNPPDLTIPTAQVNPVTVALAATNIPTNAVVQVKVTPETGASTIVQASTLSGSQASSTATASVTLPSGLSLVTASTTIDLTISKNTPPIYIDGERVHKIEVAASFGGKSDLTYITESGKRIKGANND